MPLLLSGGLACASTGLRRGSGPTSAEPLTEMALREQYLLKSK
jgi:hypothetical protein